MSSKDKKTQKELINDLTVLVKSLTERIEVLEGKISLSNPWKQRPWPTPKNRKKCPHCNGTGKVDGGEWDPYHPYFNNSF